jgi:hypothetical protein
MYDTATVGDGGADVQDDVAEVREKRDEDRDRVETDMASMVSLGSRNSRRTSQGIAVYKYSMASNEPPLECFCQKRPFDEYQIPLLSHPCERDKERSKPASPASSFLWTCGCEIPMLAETR